MLLRAPKKSGLRRASVYYRFCVVRGDHEHHDGGVTEATTVAENAAQTDVEDLENFANGNGGRINAFLVMVPAFP